ncbi:hypothetical protein D9615_010284 [Tricholomella constricta]|uniref:XPG-I domain-containing protein n=1 Tax=Tricholomella constricta TaxID=117010 RepID=A0A8H5LS27_9AGAR|nr:hypothetical protein D9615_010284 [Tricholomella constricta]
MGIVDLWKVLKAAVQTRTLAQVSLTEGFEADRRGKKSIYLGLDGSRPSACYSIEPNGPLTIKQDGASICRLLALPIVTVVVFDGPKRPLFKRQRKVKTAPHALMEAYMELLKDAGFYSYVAPGEAEAELAELNARGQVDAIITDDADAFLFGATCTIRTSNVLKDGDHISIYTLAAIENHPKVRMTRPRLLLFAMLCGGDYARGLKECGKSTAHQLCMGTSLGEDLFAAARDLSDHHLHDFLQGWRAQLQLELSENPNKVLSQCRPAAAQNISEQFPSRQVLHCYLHPVTSWSNGNAGPPLDIFLGAVRQPDLAALAVCKNLWSGISFRTFMQPLDIPSAIAAHLSGTTTGLQPPAILSILRVSLGPGNPSKSPNMWGYNVKVEPHSLVVDTLSRLPSEVRRAAESQPCKSVIIWIPACVLACTLPDLVHRFHIKKPRIHMIQQQYQPILPVTSQSSHTGQAGQLFSNDNNSDKGGRGDNLDSSSIGSDVGGKMTFGPQTRLEFLLDSLDSLLD